MIKHDFQREKDGHEVHSKHPHIRTSGLRTSGLNLTDKAPYK